MKITRIYTGEDEQSHFEEIEIPLFDQGDIGRLSEIFSASGVIFGRKPRGVTTISGTMLHEAIHRDARGLGGNRNR
ncbi:MAG: hypothetical protein Ct9H90mP9_3080 [Pseudomonadota bacterium]|nr:MAG: hypothetical protein Ct9H90mP9_3080 [Pseudomonadota bacterium]